MQVVWSVTLVQMDLPQAAPVPSLCVAVTVWMAAANCFPIQLFPTTSHLLPLDLWCRILDASTGVVRLDLMMMPPRCCRRLPPLPTALEVLQWDSKWPWMMGGVSPLSKAPPAASRVSDELESCALGDGIRLRMLRWAWIWEWMLRWPHLAG